MAEREPRLLRIYLLITTAFVVIGGSAAVLVIWSATPRSPGSSGAKVSDPAALRPVPAPEGTPAEAVARIDALVEAAVLGNPEPERSGAEADELAAGDGPAAARLLDALYRLGRDGFAEPLARRRALAADRILARLAGADAAGNAPKGPVPADPSPGWVDGRARAWLAWWDARASRPPPTPEKGPPR